MALTVGSDVINPEVWAQAITAEFEDNAAIVREGGVAATSAVIVKTDFEKGPEEIGDQVKIPYWGSIGKFVDNPEGSSVTPYKLSQRYEYTTVARKSNAVSFTKTAQSASGFLVESAKQLANLAVQTLGEIAVSTMAQDLPSMTVDGGSSALNYDAIIDAKFKFDHRAENCACIILHSVAAKALSKERATANGMPLFTDPVNGTLLRVANIPVILSTDAPCIATPPATATAASTTGTPPVIGFTGTSKKPRKIKVRTKVGGARGTWVPEVSTDDGSTWYETTSAASQTVYDSYLKSQDKKDEDTGLTMTIAAGTAVAEDHTWTATTTDRYITLLAQPGAVALWFSAANLVPLEAQNILDHSTTQASHLYYAAHRYTRVPGLNRPGISMIKHA